MTDFGARYFAPVHACLCTLLLWSCDAGTETDNPLLEFHGSTCKSGPPPSRPSTALVSAGTGVTEQSFMAGAEYDGLFCVAWDAGDAGELRIDIYNHSAGCHAEWAGHAAQSKAGLALELEVVGCQTAGCGSCIYDLSFQVEGVDVSAPLPLAITQRSCSEEPDEQVVDFTLPLDTRRSGVRCAPTPRVMLGLMPQCGRAHLPACEDGKGNGYPAKCAEDGAPKCSEGLVCADVLSQDVCLTACTADADCPIEPESCQDGVCRLREKF